MTKQTFRKHIVISSILTAFAIILILWFCVMMFIRYSPPDNNNTYVINRTVTEVYYTTPRGEVVVAVSNEDPLKLVYPTSVQNLYSSIGYDVAELAELLEGKVIQCRRMEHLPWAVEIYVDDIKIDNTKLTTQQMIATRVALVPLGLIMLAFPTVGEVMYIKSKHKDYIKENKKQKRKAERALKKCKPEADK